MYTNMDNGFYISSYHINWCKYLSKVTWCTIYKFTEKSVKISGFILEAKMDDWFRYESTMELNEQN